MSAKKHPSSPSFSSSFLEIRINEVERRRDMKTPHSPSLPKRRRGRSFFNSSSSPFSSLFQLVFWAALTYGFPFGNFIASFLGGHQRTFISTFKRSTLPLLFTLIFALPGCCSKLPQGYYKKGRGPSRYTYVSGLSPLGLVYTVVHILYSERVSQSEQSREMPVLITALCSDATAYSKRARFDSGTLPVRKFPFPFSFFPFFGRYV